MSVKRVMLLNNHHLSGEKVEAELYLTAAPRGEAPAGLGEGAESD